jgi:hypothetical protein
MSTKLTLNIDEKVVTRAKKYARKNKISVSKIVESYLNRVSSEPTGKKEKISPVIDWITSSDNKIVVTKNELLQELIKSKGK